MKAEKRVRYGEKERVRLLNMLEEAKVAEQDPIVRLRRVFKTTEKKEDETGWLIFGLFFNNLHLSLLPSFRRNHIALCEICETMRC